LQTPRKLADGGCFTCAIDPNHQDNEWPFLSRNFEIEFNTRQYFNHRSAQTLSQRDYIAKFFACEFFVQSRDNLAGSINADIGHHQARLQIVECLFVDLATRPQLSELVGKPAIPAIEARPKSFDESFTRLRFLILFLSEHEIPWS